MSKRLGKFEGCSNQTLGEQLHSILGESGEDDSLGDVESFGFYALILDHNGKSYITKEDSQGFFDYTEYESELLAKEAWQHLLVEYEASQGESDEE